MSWWLLAMPAFVAWLVWTTVRHERRRKGGGLVDGVPRSQQESNWEE